MIELMSVIYFANDLPDFGGILNWVRQLGEQAVMIIVIVLVLKHLANFKFGAILMSCVVAGVVYFVIRNWSIVSSWIDALMQQL